ncbi:MAG: zinc-binding dehydrogenase [Verrucomicrobiota bacterium]
MKAVQLLAHGAPGKFEFREVPDPTPGAEEVVIRVRACGLNRLDLWAEQGELPVKLELPRTLGCEISGEISQVGCHVLEWRQGDRVAVQSNLFCGQCEFCLRGQESICIKGEILGVHRDGGFAERVVVPSAALVRLPGKVTFESAAALTLAGSTAMHMLTHRAKVSAGDWVLVIGGASGVGSAAIQIAKGLGARVITTASSHDKHEFAKKLGADYVVDANEKWSAEVRKITGKRGVDLVVEHVGGEVLLQAFDCLARGGTIVTCGATAGREVLLKLWPMFVKEQRLIGSYGRNRRDMEATLHWAAEGKICATIDREFSLNETPQALALLRKRKVMGKLIIKP